MWCKFIQVCELRKLCSSSFSVGFMQVKQIYSKNRPGLAKSLMVGRKIVRPLCNPISHIIFIVMLFSCQLIV